MARGGRRPGAGAPKGNFNALKHGRRSAQFAELGALVAANPTTREAMLNFARRLDVKQENAVKGAVELHVRIIEEARKIARGEPSPLEHILKPRNPAPGDAQRKAGGLNVQSHEAERRSIVQNRPSAASRQHGRRDEKKNRRPHNQTRNTVPPNNQTPIRKQAQNPLIDRQNPLFDRSPLPRARERGRGVRGP